MDALTMYQYGSIQYSKWKQADVIAIFIVIGIIVLSLIGMGVAIYCISKGMNLDYSVRLSWSVLKIACKR